MCLNVSKQIIKRRICPAPLLNVFKIIITFGRKNIYQPLYPPWVCTSFCVHDDVIKWKHFPRYWPFMRGIHRSPVNSPHKGQWRGALMFCLISAWINGWVNNREIGGLRRHRAHYDVPVLYPSPLFWGYEVYLQHRQSLAAPEDVI